MRNFMTVASGIVFTPVLLQVRRCEDLWDSKHISDTWAKHVPDIDVSEILVRYTRGSDEVDQLVCEWKPPSARLLAAKDLALTVMGSLRGEQLGRVIITRLPPGKTIPRHSDTIGEYAKFFTRFHVPLQSAEGVVFECGDETTNMVPGNLYWFNHALPHSITNYSSFDRINLIIDVRMP